MRPNKLILRFLAAATIGLGLSACVVKPGYANVRLPAIESDNMVLQAGDHTRLYGEAAAGEVLTIKYGDCTATATADQDGHWQTFLSGLKTGEKFDIVVKGSNTVTIRNVLVGQVWLCSGQSNMELSLAQAFDGAQEARDAAKHDQIRFFVVRRKMADTPQSDVEGEWWICQPVTAAAFSAVGYFFGCALNADLHSPVGLIESNWGGTPAQCWTSLEGLAADPVTSERYGAVAKQQVAEVMESLEKYEKLLASYKADTKYVGGDKSKQPARPLHLQYPHAPAVLYNGMIAPLKPFTIGGVIWYQGESNAQKSDDAMAYRRLFPAMIRDWRKQFENPNLPFLYVQLANYDKKEDPNERSPWAELRESQLLTLGMPNTGMAVAIDIGNEKDIHPLNKRDVGTRLERIAMARVYGKEQVFSGPIFSGLTVKGNKAVCSFKYAEHGLKAGADGKVTGVVICGPDKKFVPAGAIIEGSTVVVSSPSVSKPVAVRYAWQGAPPANLYNADGLPASPFRSDVPPTPSLNLDGASAQK